MVADSSTLTRYALAYVKKSGGNIDIKEFLQLCNIQNTTDWSEGNFDKVYGEFTSTSGYNTRNSNSSSTGPKTTHVFVNNRGLDFWDFLLLQCCIDSLFGRHTVVHNHNYGDSRYQGRENKKKDSEDSRKLLALGIVAAVICVAFHIGMCFWYYSSKKSARKSEKVDYLDNKLKTFRNIEFTVSAISLAALITCAFCPVLPEFGLAVLGINFLICFAGGLAFHMKHNKESDNIEKAKAAVNGYNAPSAPPAYQFSEPNAARQPFENCR